jgi:hypothetical protein
MEPEDLFPYSKELTIGLYPEPDESSPHLPTLDHVPRQMNPTVIYK